MCELATELQLLHKWLHRTIDALSKEDVDRAEQLSCRILRLLNEDTQLSNGIKLLAIYDTMTSGVWHMEQTADETPETPGTIH
jgi:hypothetical protein